MKRISTAVVCVWLIFAPIKGLCHRKNRKIMVGIILVVSGAYLATNPVAAVPHFLWDAAAYGMHGIGLVPLIKALGRLKIGPVSLDMEDLEDEPAKPKGLRHD